MLYINIISFLYFIIYINIIFNYTFIIIFCLFYNIINISVYIINNIYIYFRNVYLIIIYI